jgi:hypothetical protein
MYTIRLPSGSEFKTASADVLVEWAQQRRIPADAMILQVDEPPVRADQHPLIKHLAVRPPTVQGAVTGTAISEPPLGGLIPVNNSKALIGYYMGIGALVPLLGVIFAIAALTLGVLGLRDYAANPARRGRTHAIVAVVLGSLSLLGHATVLVLIMLAH